MRYVPLLTASVLLAAPAAAQEAPAASKIVAVDLFKNGLCVVKREATLGKAGTYVLDDVPQPVHGTYWVESAVPVETVVKMRDVAVPAAESVPGNLQDDLAGKKVTVHLKGDKHPPVVGTVAKFKPAKAEDAPAAPIGYVGGAAVTASQYLVVLTAKGRTLVDASEIASVEAEGADVVNRRQPRLLLTLAATDQPETKVVIRYL